MDWLADKFDHQGAAEAAVRIERAYAGGIKPCEFGGKDGTVSVGKAVLAALDQRD